MEKQEEQEEEEEQEADEDEDEEEEAGIYREINCFLLQENEWSRSYSVTNQHPNLRWNFVIHEFLDPSAFPEGRRVLLVSFVRQLSCK